MGEGWRKVTGGKKKCSNDPAEAQLSYILFHGTHVQKMVSLAWPEGGRFGPLTSKVHLSDSGTCPVISTSFKWFELKLAWVDSKFLNENLGNHVIISATCYWEDMQVCVKKTMTASLTGKGTLELIIHSASYHLMDLTDDYSVSLGSHKLLFCFVPDKRIMSRPSGMWLYDRLAHTLLKKWNT